MFASKFKMMVVLVLTLGMLGTGAGAFFLPQVPLGSRHLPGGPASRVGPPTPVRATTDRYGDPLPPDAVARMGTVRFHQAVWNGVLVFTPDGKAVVSTGRGKEPIVFWDAATGRKLRQIEAPEEQMGVLAFAPDGKLLASVDQKAIRLWNAASGKEVRAIVQSSVRSLAFSPDGKTFASGGDDRSVRLWDTANGKELWRNLWHDRPVYTVLFAPDGKTLISGSDDDIVRFWDVAKRKEIRQIRSDQHLTRVLALSPDGKVLAMGGQRFLGGKVVSQLRLLDMAGGKELHVLDGPKYGAYSVAFSPDGKLLVASDYCEELRLWEVATGREVRRIRGREGIMAGCSVFAPDSKTLATRTRSAIRLLDVATGKPLHDWPGHDEDVRTLAFSHDGKLLASGGRDIRLWAADSGEQQRILPGHVLASLGKLVRAVALTPDGRSLISAGPERILRRRDLATGKETGQFLITDSDADKDKQQVLDMHLSADGKTLAALSVAFDELTPKLLSVWDTASGKRLVRNRLGLYDWFNGGLFLPDNRTVILYVKGELILQDVMSGRHLFAFTMNAHTFVSNWAISADGKLLATRDYSLTPATEKTATKKARREVTATCVYLWELDTGKRLLRIATKTRGNHLAFSSDGKLLAGDDDRTIALWDVANGAELRSFSGFESGVHSFAFSFDGKRLASGLADGTILVWDTNTAAAQAGRKLPKIDEKDLETLWNDLAGEDGPKAHAAIGRLTVAPDRALPLLTKRLQPVSPIPEERMRHLIADLDSADFTTRQAATLELEKLDELAETALRRELIAKPSAEVRKRIEGLLAAPRKTPMGEEIRRFRAIRVLEHIGSAEARRVLQTLAAGAPAARATADAQAALERLRRRLPH